jgi:hypothetical protein
VGGGAPAPSTSSAGRTLRSSAIIHVVIPVRRLSRRSSWPFGGAGGSFASRRRIALTNPRSRATTAPTVSLTAACAGILVWRSWYAPSRSAARAPGVIRSIGLAARAPIAASSSGT